MFLIFFVFPFFDFNYQCKRGCFLFFFVYFLGLVPIMTDVGPETEKNPTFNPALK